jgi:hypothetical protein
MKLMDPKTEELFSVVSVTENLQDAKLLLEVFLKGSTKKAKDRIMKELESRDSRFVGWDATHTYEYDYTNVSGDALYIGRAVAKQLREGKYKAKLFLYEGE